MKIKTYRVTSLTQAIEKIKRDLGPEAVILSTKKIAHTDSWWGGGKFKLEVTAALHGVAKNSEGIKKENSDFKSFFDQFKNHNPFQSKKSSVAPVALSNDVKAPSLQPSTTMAPSLQTSFVRELELSDSEVRLSHQMEETALVLKEHGVMDELIDQVLTHLTLKNTEGDTNQEAAGYIASQMPPFKDLESLLSSSSRIVSFIGSTGVGKTSSLIKLASLLTYDLNKKVGIIDLDRNKQGLNQELKLYAEILNAPYAQIQDEDDLDQCLHAFRNLDVVLVDTTGVNIKNSQALDEMRGFLAHVSEFKVHEFIVLPAYLRAQDLESYLDSLTFKNISQSLIVTKLDEIDHFGTLINAPYLSGLSLSYFGLGCDIPEDIEAATVERLLDCLFDFTHEAQDEGDKIKDSQLGKIYESVI